VTADESFHMMLSRRITAQSDPILYLRLDVAG
jgi:hypothetical protein